MGFSQKKISFSGKVLFNTELSMQNLLKALHVIIICVDIVVFRGNFLLKFYFLTELKNFFTSNNHVLTTANTITENMPEIASN